MSLVGKKFPSIAVDAISEMGDNLKINIFEEATQNEQKVLLFWYPKDFTFVCPTELGDLADNYAEFQKMGVEIYSVSTDTHFTHKAWHDSSDEIKKIRKKLHLTQKEFAQLVGSSKPTIERWEKENAQIRGPIVLLIEMLNHDMDYVVSLKIPPEEIADSDVVYVQK